MKTDEGILQFLIYRVFGNKSKEKIGYITCAKQIENNGNIIILDIKIFRDSEHFQNNGGVSVLDELERLIENFFQNKKIKKIKFTCIKGNTMERTYDKRFTEKYKPNKKEEGNLIVYT